MKTDTPSAKPLTQEQMRYELDRDRYVRAFEAKETAERDRIVRGLLDVGDIESLNWLDSAKKLSAPISRRVYAMRAKAERSARIYRRRSERVARKGG